MNIYLNGRYLTQKLTGVQRFAFEITKQLHECYKNDLIILLPNNIDICKSYNDIQFNIKNIGINKGHLWEQLDLPIYLLKKSKPLLINLTNSAPVLYDNKISTIHDLSVLYKNWYNKFYSIFYKFMIPRILRNSKKILTVSQFTKKCILVNYNIDADNITIIYNGISKEFEKIEKNIKKENYILFVGSNNKRKNLGNLLKAFQSLNDSNLTLKLIGINKEDLKNYDINFKNIECLGHIYGNKLYNYYRNAKIFIYPSYYEGFGIPLIEAMASGCPAIASDIDVFKEICDDAVMYVDPHDYNDIKDKIFFLNNNKKKCSELVDKGYKIIKKFSWKTESKKIVDCINKI